MKINLTEQQGKINFLMKYDKGKTRIENLKNITEQTDLNSIPTETLQDTADTISRGTKSGNDIYRIFNKLSPLYGKKYKGGDAISYLIKYYNNRYNTNLIADIKNNPRELNVQSIELQKKILSLLQNTKTYNKPNNNNNIHYSKIQWAVKNIKHHLKRGFSGVDDRDISTILNTLKPLEGKTFSNTDAISYLTSYYYKTYNTNIADEINNRSPKLTIRGTEDKAEVLKLLQVQPTKEVQQQQANTQQANTQQAKTQQAKTNTNVQGYTLVTGNEDEPYQYGSLGSGIKQLQTHIGVNPDGKWGVKTNEQLNKKGFTGKSFTNSNINDVIKSIS